MFKDILTRYDLPPDTDYVPPKRILQYCVEEYISRGVKEDHTDLKKFLDNVIPFEGKRHFIYVQDEEGTTYNFHLDRYDCIKALLALCEHKLTVYFHPTAFKKWTKDKPVKQLVAELGLSQSTVYRIRSEIKAKK